MVMERTNSCTLPNAHLPRWESIFYVTAWITIALKLLYALYEVSRDYAEHRDVSRDLDTGWNCFGRQKDATDTEWEFWRESVFGSFGIWLTGHMILSQLCRHDSLYTKRKYVFLVYSLLSYISLVGFGPLLLIVIETFAVFFVSWFTRSALFVWTVTLGFLLVLNFDFLRRPLVLLGLLAKGPFLVYYFQEFTLCIAVLRLTSFGLCCCDSVKSEKKLEEKKLEHRTSDSNECHDQDISELKLQNEQTTSVYESIPIKDFTVDQIIELFFFVFYLPLFVAGPMMNYNEFCQQFYAPLERWTFQRLKVIAIGFLRFLIWGFFYEIMLHYLHSGVLINKPSLLSVLPLWAIAGTGYAYGMFFVVKYVVIWAFSTAIARLDQVDPPDIPSCGSHIYLYSKMWKTFDRGLYAFLKQHVYILLGGSRCGLLRRVTALFACFGFVAVWHGLHSYIIIWCLFNFMTVLIEAFAGYLTSSPALIAFEVKHLSPAMVRRLHSLAMVPVLAISTFSLVTFFAGLQPGYVLLYRLLVEGFPASTCLVAFTFYCVIQTGKEVENYQARHQHSKVE